MKMKEAITKLAVAFGPKGKNPHHLVGVIMKVMPDKDVPDATLRKVMAVGKLLKSGGVE